VTNRSTLDDVSPGTMNNPEGEKGTVLENPQIVRGPYLQQGTESGISIRWATTSPAQGRFGTVQSLTDFL